MKDSSDIKSSPNLKRNRVFNQDKLQEMANDLSNSQREPKEKKKPLLVGNCYRFNGCGSTLIGKTAFRQDGTFITTVWVTVLFIPIIPIESLRISRAGNNFTVFEKDRLNLKQILLTYLFAALYAGWLIGVYHFCDYFNYTAWSLVIAVVALTVPIFIPTLLGYYAEKNAMKES